MGGGMSLSFSVHGREMRPFEQKSTCNNSGSSSRAVWTKKPEVHSERSNHMPENRGTWLSSSIIKLDFDHFKAEHEQQLTPLQFCMHGLNIAGWDFWREHRFSCPEVYYNDGWIVKTFFLPYSTFNLKTLTLLNRLTLGFGAQLIVPSWVIPRSGELIADISVADRSSLLYKLGRQSKY